MNPRKILRSVVAATLFLVLVSIPSFAQNLRTDRLDFLKSQDSSFALLANTSATYQTGKRYPDELLLITGLPFNPTISARVDLGVKPICAGTDCGGIRNVALSPDGDTALVSSDPSDVQAPAVRGVSTLFLLRNVAGFVRSKNPADLRISSFTALDFPQLDNVSGLAFGPSGTWAVVSTVGPGPITGYKRLRGTVVIVTGLPDDPVFSAPIDTPMHSQGSIDLSIDGDRLLLNDVHDRSETAERSNQIVIQGFCGIVNACASRVIGFTSEQPQVIATSTIVKPEGFPEDGPPVVRDARLSLDGRFVIAPIGLIRGFNEQQIPIAYDQLAILKVANRRTGEESPGEKGATLEVARLLTADDGVEGGPYFAGISPNGDSALVVNGLDFGGAKLLTGLASGDPAQFQLKPLPFAFFGPSFPLGPTGPPALAAHGQPTFTADGETALVVNFIPPPRAAAPLSPSVSVLTGFESGNIRLTGHLTAADLNTFDFTQQIATVPSGLQDYINLYVPAGEIRTELIRLVDEAIARSDRGERGPAVLSLLQIIERVNSLKSQGALTRARASVLVSLATVGMQVAAVTNIEP